MRPSNCPKFDKCNAPICPLDANHLQGCHLDGEKVCYYLTQAAKPGTEAILRGALPQGMLEVIREATPGIVSRWGRIRRVLERASRTQTRLTTQPPKRGAS